MEGDQPLTDWDGYHFELLSLFPGCSSFEVDNFGNLTVAYIMKAIEAGRKQRLERLHLDSIMSAHLLSQNFNMNRGKDVPPLSPDDYLIFKKLAYPEKQIEFSPTTIATVQAIAKTAHPPWIHQSLPWGQLLGMKSKADPAKPLMLCSGNMVAIAPEFVQGWLKCELAAFSIAKADVGKRITLYNPETNKPIIDLQLRDTVGQGYYQDEQFKILYFHEAVGVVSG